MGKQFTRRHIFSEREAPLQRSAWLLKHRIDLSRPKHPDMDLIIEHKHVPAVAGGAKNNLQLLIAKRNSDGSGDDLYYVADKETLPKLRKRGIIDDQGYKLAQDALKKIDLWRHRFTEAYRDSILLKLIMDEVQHIASYDHAIYSTYPMKPDVEGDFSVYDCSQMEEKNARWFLVMTQPLSFSGFGDASAILVGDRHHPNSWGPFRPVSDNTDIRSLIPNGFYRREP